MTTQYFGAVCARTLGRAITVIGPGVCILASVPGCASGLSTAGYFVRGEIHNRETGAPMANSTVDLHLETQERVIGYAAPYVTDQKGMFDVYVITDIADVVVPVVLALPIQLGIIRAPEAPLEGPTVPDRAVVTVHLGNVTQEITIDITEDMISASSTPNFDLIDLGTIFMSSGE